VTPRRRWSLIALAAIATGVVTYLAPEGSKPVEVAAPVQRAEAVPAVVRAQAPIGELPSRQPIGRQRGDIFATRSWAPPPSAPPQPAAPAPPPNPYRFAGTVHHDGQRKVFLAMGDRIFEAKEGEMLEQNFRVQSVAADAVTLVYVPLEMPVTMALAFQDAPPAAAAGQTAPASGPTLPKPPTAAR
jgi:hypothetical protein